LEICVPCGSLALFLSEFVVAGSDKSKAFPRGASVSLCALVAALAGASSAAAQQQLPTIVVEVARKTVSHKPAATPHVVHVEIGRAHV
jgi:hypothetical protein